MSPTPIPPGIEGDAVLSFGARHLRRARVGFPSRELPAMLRDGNSWNVLSVTARATYLRFMEERRRGEHRPASCVDTRNRGFRGFLRCARESAYPDVNSEAMRRGR